MPIKDVQKTNTQHAVPQNIMDVEFKVIGELTLRQFAYLLVFWGTAYLAAVYMAGIFKWPLVVFCTLLGLGLAFVPVQERGMDQWIINFIKAMYTPNQKIWKKDPVVPSAFLYQNMAVVRQELITLAPTSSRRKLEEYLMYEESFPKVDKLDIPEQEYVQMVRQAFSGSAGSVRTEQEPIRPVKFDMDFAPGTPGNLGTGFPPQPAPAPTPTPVAPVQQAQEPHIQKTAGPFSRPSVEEMAMAGPPPVPTPAQPKPVTEAPPQQPAVQIKKPPVVSTSVPGGAQLEIKHSKLKHGSSHESSYSDVYVSPMTPDRHAGRRFMSLLPKQGQLVLPLRGGKVLKTEQDNNFDEDLKSKTEQLNILINQIKGDKIVQKNISKDFGKLKEEQRDLYSKLGKNAAPAQPILEKIEKPSITVAEPKKSEDREEVLSLIDSFKVEFERLTKKIVRLRADIEDTGGMDIATNSEKRQLLEKLEQEKLKATKEYEAIQAKTKELEAKLDEQKKQRSETERVSEAYTQKVEERRAEDYEILKRRVAELQEMLRQKETQTRTVPVAVPVQAPVDSGPGMGPAAARYAKMQPLTSNPNVLSGVVKGFDGVGLEGIVVVIKNGRGETVRAIKSNALGQFVLLTPLSNGMYNIEIDQFRKSGYSFDIISVEAKGEIIPPIEFTGRGTN